MDNVELYRYLGKLLQVALVRQFVGKAVLAGTFGENFADKGLGESHVLKPDSLQGVFIQPVILHEIVNGFHLADILQVVVRVALHDRFGRHPRQRTRQVRRDQFITGHRIDHGNGTPTAFAYLCQSKLA